jgi:hypothetical protein
MRVCEPISDNYVLWLVSDYFSLVLREIEAEDSLWHEKKTAQSQAEKRPEPEKEQKRPTQPSEEKATDEVVKTQSTRKLRFY